MNQQSWFHSAWIRCRCWSLESPHWVLLATATTTDIRLSARSDSHCFSQVLLGARNILLKERPGFTLSTHHYFACALLTCRSVITGWCGWWYQTKQTHSASNRV